MDIVIIGTGNTATVLGKKLKEGGNSIVQVIGRNIDAAKALAIELDAGFATKANLISLSADLYLLAVSDKAVGEVAFSLQLHNKTLVHTAASVPLKVLRGSAQHYGVFYPLQSMRKEIRHLPEIPLLIDASDEKTLQLLKLLAATISKDVMVADDALRLKMHLSAVIVNNFSNHLFTLVEKYCRESNIPFSLFLPLIQETVSRLSQVPPSQAQTGPAVRNDSLTIEKHLSLLDAAPEFQRFYQLFTESIQRHHS